MNNVPYYKLANYPRVTPAKIIKTVAASGTPEAVAAVGTFCTTFIVMGRKAARTDNTDSVYVGWEATNDAQIYTVVSGGEVWFNAPEGAKWDLGELYVDVVTNADGVVILYW